MAQALTLPKAQWAEGSSVDNPVEVLAPCGPLKVGDDVFMRRPGWNPATDANATAPFVKCKLLRFKHSGEHPTAAYVLCTELKFYSEVPWGSVICL